MNDTEPETAPAAGDGATTASETRSAAAGTELVYDDTPAPPGRPVRLEPTPPGFWRVVIGALVALLAPLFGILVGSGMGTDDTASMMGPLYWGFFVGGLIGVVGLVVAGFGAATLRRHSRAGTPGEEDS